MASWPADLSPSPLGASPCIQGKSQTSTGRCACSGGAGSYADTARATRCRCRGLACSLGSCLCSRQGREGSVRCRGWCRVWCERASRAHGWPCRARVGGVRRHRRRARAMEERRWRASSATRWGYGGSAPWRLMPHLALASGADRRGESEVTNGSTQQRALPLR